MRFLILSPFCVLLFASASSVAILRADDWKFDLKYIDPDAASAIFVHPQVVMQNPAIRKFILEMDASEPENQPWRAAEIDEVKFTTQLREEKLHEQSMWITDSMTITRMIQPSIAIPFFERLTARGYAERTEADVKFHFRPLMGNSLPFAFPFESFLSAESRKRMAEQEKFYADKGYIVHKIDEQTIMQSERSIPTFLSIPDLKQSAVKKPRWLDKFAAVSTKPLIVVANLPKFGEQMKAEFARFPSSDGSEMIFRSLMSVFSEKGDYAIITLDTEKDLHLHITVTSPTPEASVQVFSSIEGMRTLLRAALTMIKPKVSAFDDKDAEFNEKFRTFIDKTLKQATMEQRGIESSLVLSIQADDLEYFLKSVAKIGGVKGESVWKKKNQNHLKQITVAILNYHLAHLLHPTNAPHASNKPAVSWRVKILPFIEEQELYKQYNQDEPWDSENNKKVFAKMPAIFRHPLQHPADTNTGYFMLTGKDGAIGDGLSKRESFKEIPDGKNNTLMIVDAEREIPWTKPEDIEVEKGKIPVLGRKEAKSFDCAMFDGSLQRLSTQISSDDFWALFTAANDDVVDWDKLYNRNAKPLPSTGQSKTNDPFSKAISDDDKNKSVPSAKMK